MPAEPLAALHDIQLPPPVSMWPPAPGWWLLGVLMVALIAGGIWMARRRWRQQRYRQVAVQSLRQCYQQWQADHDAGRYLHAASRTLKQAALVAYPRAQVAALHGADWTDFLVATGGREALRGPAGQSLLAVYQPAGAVTPEQIQQLQPLLEHWLRRHRAGAST